MNEAQRLSWALAGLTAEVDKVETKIRKAESILRERRGKVTKPDNVNKTNEELQALIDGQKAKRDMLLEEIKIIKWELGMKED